MNLAPVFYGPWPRRIAFLATLSLLAPLMTACSAVNALTPRRGDTVKVLKMDPSKEPSLVDADGARWVLFKMDIGGGARRVLRSAVEGAATVGQSVGQSVVDVSPEEKFMRLMQTAHETSRIQRARLVLSESSPVLPFSARP